MLLFDKSMRRKRLKLEKAFGVISVMEFCSKRLKIENIKKKLFFIQFHHIFSIHVYEKLCSLDDKGPNGISMGKGWTEVLTIQLFLLAIPMAHELDFSHDNQQFHQHNGMDVDNYSIHHIP